MNKIEIIQDQFNSSLKRSIREIGDLSWQKDVGVNMVFGISQSGLPARFLAGFIPAFSLTEALQDHKKIQPELRIFIPLHLASHCNTISLDQGGKIIQQGVLFIQKFQEIFHPNIQWFLDVDQPLTQEAINLLTHISDKLIRDPESNLQNQWQKIQTAAELRGSGITAKIYAPHHVFGWHECFDPEHFFPAQPKHITINCMSRSEEKFREVRNKVKGVISSESPELIVHGEHLDLTTCRCPGPHYIRSKINNTLEEPSIEGLILEGFDRVRNELVNGLSENPGIRTALLDLDSIAKHINTLRKERPTLPNIDDFIQEVTNATK